MATFYDRFYVAPAGGGGGVEWSRWMDAGDLTLSATNNVTVNSGPTTSGDAITFDIQNDAGATSTSIRTSANYSFDLASINPSWDPTAVQQVLVDMRIPAMATRGMVVVGPCELTLGAEFSCSVGAFDRIGTYHCVSMVNSGAANRSAGMNAAMLDQLWCSIIGDPNFQQGVGSTVTSEDGTNVRTYTGARDFGAASTTFAVSMGFTDTVLRANETMTWQMRFAVIDLD